ncbi:MAG: histidine phosphatase family protein [Rhodocyclaceae bacterium]|nr:MAG: histidine phosphatase family protein [Rhodocyclaceae bacterium]
MDLILWRHAEAEAAGPGMADSDRNLTEKGRKQAKHMADWLLAQRLPKLSVIVSPTKRTVQTAEALGHPYKVNRKIGPAAGAADLIAAANWPDESGAVILVAHMPGLGRLAALLLGGAEFDWTIKKAGIWWFSNRVRHDETQTILRAVANP